MRKRQLTIYHLPFISRMPLTFGRGKQTDNRRQTTENKSRGDTIIEVMAAITIIGLALGTAYALSNRSYRTGQSTVERAQALALAQGQVEFLKNLGLNGEIGDLLATSNYGTGGKFCFSESSGTAVAATTGSYCYPYGAGANKTLFNIDISYCNGGGCSPAGVFTISANWQALGGSQSQLKIFYKAVD